jgi:hypothetical protein
MRASIKQQEQLDAPGSEEPGVFSPRYTEPWQLLGLRTTVKPPALRLRAQWSDVEGSDQEPGRCMLPAVPRSGLLGFLPGA